MDLAVDRLLRDRLSSILTAAAWLSEETADTPARLGADMVFIVDPIDGTRGFMNGDPQFSISVAVVVGTRPVAAIVHAPAVGQIFTARLGRGAALNGRPIAIAANVALAGARVAGPKFLIDPAARRLDLVTQPKVPSLALRFARVASGTFEAAVASTDANDWDVAAADLILHEAGAGLRTLEGAELTYNKPQTRHGILIAASERLQAPLREALSAITQDRRDQTAARS